MGLLITVKAILYVQGVSKILSILKPNLPNHSFWNALFTTQVVNNASNLLVN
jgi:hypothetical protein